ncbi:MAG: AMP-binding protein, partial [Chloroflexota bacterium]
MNLFDRFEQNVHVHPNKPAFIYFHKRKWKTLTYQNIFDQTQRFLRGLEAGPLTSGLTAALLTPPSPEFFPFALALLKFGIVPILAEPALGIKKIGEIYAEAKPDIFVGNALTHTVRLFFGWGRESVKYNLTIRKVEGRKSKVAPSSIVHRPSSEPVAIIYTSGSTSLPKGAIYTQDNLAAQLDLLKNTFQITSDEIDLPAFPIYALIDLLFGVTSVIPDISFPIPGKTDAAKVIDAIQKFNVTNMFASPVVLDLLSSFAEKNPLA